jgi:hypothetical protein
MARTKAGSPANRPPLKFKNGSGDLMKELQKMVCLQVLEHITCYGKTKDRHKIWPAAHEKYYGPSCREEGDERMSYVEKAHRGLEMFQFLYKIEDNLQGYAGPQRVLNQELLGRSADAPRIVSSFKEGDLTIQILSCHSFSNRQHLAGRTIWSNGKKTVASCKKMLALVKVSEYKDGLPSGRNFADYIQYVREQYWKTFELPNILKKEQNGTEATAEASDAGDDGDDNEDEEDPEVLPTLDENLDPEKVQEYMDKHMKEKWFPSGILSFALWGPIRPDGCDETYISRCFYKSMDELSYGNGSKNKSKDGRGSMRKQHAADEASDRASASVSCCHPIYVTSHIHNNIVPDECGIMAAIAKAAGGNLLPGRSFNIYDVTTFDAYGTLSHVKNGTIEDSTNSRFFNNARVKQALNAPDETLWMGCIPGAGRRRYLRAKEPVSPQENDAADFIYEVPPEYYPSEPLLEQDRPISTAPYIAELLDDAKIDVLIYNGDRDMACCAQGSEAVLDNMKWSGADDWKHAQRALWLVDDKMAGYVKKAKNLTFNIAFNSGHMFPTNQPVHALDLVTRFIQREDFADVPTPNFAYYDPFLLLPLDGAKKEESGASAAQEDAQQNKTSGFWMQYVLGVLICFGVGMAAGFGLAMRRHGGHHYSSVPDTTAK